MRVVFSPAGECTVTADDGSPVSRFPTVWEPAFNRQYSTPLSSDGSHLFIGTWERGLYCYRTRDGALLWRAGPGKVRELLLAGDTIVAEMADRGVIQRRVADGSVLQRLPMSGITSFFPLASGALLVGPKRGRYFLLRLPDLVTSHVLPAKSFNPTGCLSFLLLTCQESGTALEITGWEEHPCKRRRFRRVVPVAA